MLTYRNKTKMQNEFSHDTVLLFYLMFQVSANSDAQMGALQKCEADLRSDITDNTEKTLPCYSHLINEK